MLATQLTVATRHRRLLWMGLGLGVALSFAAIFASGPVAAYLLAERAKARGFDLVAQGVKVRWLAIECSEVWLRRQAPLLDAHLDGLVLGVSWKGELEQIQLQAGAIEAQGSPEAFKQAFRGAQGTARSDETHVHQEVRASNLKVHWKATPNLTLTAKISALEQDRSGKLTLTGEELRVQAPRKSAELGGVKAEFVIVHGARKLSTLHVGSAALELGETTAADKEPRAPNATLPAVAPSVALRTQLDDLAARAAPLLTDTFQMRLDEFSVSAHLEKQAFNLGKEKAILVRSPDLLTLSVEPAGELLAKSTPLRLQLVLPFKATSPLSLSIEGGPITLKELGLSPGALGIDRPEQATLEASTQVEVAAGGNRVSFSGKGAVSELSLRHPQLSAEPIQNLQLGLIGKGSLDVPQGLLTLEEAVIQLGQVRVVGKGSLEKKAEHLAIHGTLEVPLCACQTAKDSLPQGLIPALSAVSLSGTFAFLAHIDADTQNPSDTKVTWDLNNECHVDSIVPELNPERFRKPFTHQVVGSHDEALFLETGPGTASWTSSAEIPDAFISALLVSEDGNFYHHQGFDHRALQKSVHDNLQAGKFLRGGSTISMQLAKNLYLKREKTLSRKLQEAFFTLLLEQELKKDEILELYANVIEYGPDVYGLRQAALYYFNTTPAELSTAQSFFLVSILPNPKAERFTANGALKPRWASYLRTLMRIAHDRKRLSDPALALGLAEELHFGKPSTVSQAAASTEPTASTPEAAPIPPE